MQKATLLAGLKANPGDPIFLEPLGHLLETEQAWDELLEIFKSHHSSVPSGTHQEAYVLYMLGKASVELGSMEAALPWLERSVQIRSDFPYSHHLLGRCYRHVGRLDDALKAFQACTQLAPEFPWSLLEAGEICLQRGEPKGSLQFLRSGLDRQRQQHPADTQLFEAAITQAEQSLARQQLAALAAELWPDRPALSDLKELNVLDQYRLSLHRFRRLLDRVESVSGEQAGTERST